jgi:hypothetical protein
MGLLKRQVHLKQAHWVLLQQWADRRGIASPSLAIEKLIEEQLLRKGTGDVYNYEGKH